jgi:hypothetical protein
MRRLSILLIGLSLSNISFASENLFDYFATTNDNELTIKKRLDALKHSDQIPRDKKVELEAVAYDHMAQLRAAAGLDATDYFKQALTMGEISMDGFTDRYLPVSAKAACSNNALTAFCATAEQKGNENGLVEHQAETEIN